MKLLFEKSKEVIYIESCYRIIPDSKFYELFKPKSELAKKIEENIRWRKEECIGVHIRGTDHFTALNFSKFEKFLNLIESVIQKII